MPGRVSLLEPVYQVDRVEVAAAGAVSHDVGSNGAGEVRLAGARTTDEQDVALAGQERAPAASASGLR